MTTKRRPSVRSTVKRARSQDRGVRTSPSLKSWGDAPPRTAEGIKIPSDVVVSCGWGRLIFGHTFRSPQRLVETLAEEAPGSRDIALYLRDPHVILALAPHQLFLDPSHTYRLYLSVYRPSTLPPPGIVIRRIKSREDIAQANRILSAAGMVSLDEELVWKKRRSRVLMHLVACNDRDRVLGTVTGVDHVHAFSDPENGSSLWCLAVDPQAQVPGLGEALTRYLAEHYQARERAFLDLSVMHDNHSAIALYEKIGFKRVPVFCLKNKNAINEKLFAPPQALPKLNPYAMIIIDEAMRRGITVEVLDAEQAFFRLTHGGRSVVCRESLSELTSAVAMSRCQDKALTRRVMERAGVAVPAQQPAGLERDNVRFLERHRRVVVKPSCGEQGKGVTVDVRTPAELREAIARAGDEQVLLEEYVEGQDLRLVLIDHELVAAAVRKAPVVVGTGEHSVRQLVEKLSRRRQAATGGESHIPLDEETERVVRSEGLSLDDVLPFGRELTVRKTANLHTGGTIHDVTAELHPALREAAINASRALDIPVTGLDFIVRSVDAPDYAFIEANERPGLANHEPQPTAERFVDLLFPQTVSQTMGRAIARSATI